MKTLLLFLFLIFSYTVFAQTVYITKTGSKYHLSKCSYLSSSKISIDLNEAKERGFTSCGRCKPDKKLNSNVDTEKKNKKEVKKKTTTTTNRCEGITKKGSRCKRNAQKGSRYCWQHKK